MTATLAIMPERRAVAELPYLTDEEVREICFPLEQPAAMIRYLQQEVMLPIVRRKPNGMPLVGRDAFRQCMGATNVPVTASKPTEASDERPDPAALRKLFSQRRRR